jgi:hypothetical protein
MTITVRHRVVRVVIDPAGRAGCPWRVAGLWSRFSDPVHRSGSRCRSRATNRSENLHKRNSDRILKKRGRQVPRLHLKRAKVLTTALRTFLR